MATTDGILGVFVGGQGRRMGGVSKALLSAPGTERSETLVQRLVRLGRAADLEVVLVGRAELAGSVPGVRQLADRPAGIGPLGGLGALLDFAAERPALAVACDLPYVTEALIRRLASEAPSVTVLASRDLDTGKWQPLFARYAAPGVRAPLAQCLSVGERSFQNLFKRCEVTELALDAAERAALRDWDTPDDMR